jgi:hypothetical protein
MMTAGKWSEAKAASTQAVTERPNSGFALYGIAQATEKTGDTGATATAYKQFLSAWKMADPGLPQVKHAQEWLSQHGAPGTSGLLAFPTTASGATDLGAVAGKSL